MVAMFINMDVPFLAHTYQHYIKQNMKILANIGSTGQVYIGAGITGSMSINKYYLGHFLIGLIYKEINSTFTL